MQFNLNSRWAVTTEENQVTISKRQIVSEGKNKGKEYLTPSYYYNNFKDALEGLIDRDINGLEKVEEIAERISELKAEIKIMLKSACSASSEPRRAVQNKKPNTDKGAGKDKKGEKAVKQRLSD